VRIETVKVKNENGAAESMQLIVVPEDGSLNGYIRFTTVDGEEVSLDKEDIFITQNASMVLDFTVSDRIYLQNLDLIQCETSATEIVENYLGNSVYMTQGQYETLFGPWKPNGAFTILSGTEEEKLEFSKQFGRKEELLSCTSTQEMEEDFTVAFTLIRMVVVVVLVMAAALAFTVLFTLATTNISERDRELATIKVLGFFDGEVHSYVNKETMILTGIGILLGLPAGKVFGAVLMGSLEMSGIFFKPTLHNVSYVMAVFVVLGFALVVNLITNRVLDKINPVEALKSVE
ncbi:MAG: ABC transporter permease, partial [Clostridium sp.]|nr:ABC transporter permease [Clostridium sp.]